MLKISRNTGADILPVTLVFITGVSKNLCRERELDGRYLEFLQAYLKKLETETASDPVKDYESKKILMDLIRSEDYLLVSDNREIRDTYIQIRNVIGELYNAYMSIVR